MRLIVDSCFVWPGCDLPAIVRRDGDDKEGSGLKQEKEATVSETTLPEKVRKTFVAKFPNATINKADAEKEGGVMVWDINFATGESTRNRSLKTARCWKSASRSAEVGAGGRIEVDQKGGRGRKVKQTDKVAISYEIKDGKLSNWTSRGRSMRPASPRRTDRGHHCR